MLLLRLVLLSLSLLSSIRSFPFVPFGERSEDTFVCYFRFRSALLQSLSFQRIFVRVFALPTVFSTVCLGENVLALFHRSIHVRCSTASLLRSRCVSNFCQLSFPGLRGGVFSHVPRSISWFSRYFRHWVLAVVFLAVAHNAVALFVTRLVRVSSLGFSRLRCV